MQNKKIIIYVIVGIVTLVGVFYGGMVYGKNQTGASAASRFGTNMQNKNNPGVNNRMAGGGFSTGEIISKDDKSITIKLADSGPASTNASLGGSKIIFLSTNTEITKTVTGSINDLVIGTQVSTTGTANSDGSVTAKSIQVRPKMMIEDKPAQ